MSQRFVDPDMWGHIQYGADWINAGEMPRTASHTYADPDYVWVNHENISELVMAVIQKYFGGMGLTIGKCLLGVLVLLLIRFNATRRGVNGVVASLILLPVAYSLASSWCLRPQLASFICFVLMILILESVDRNREPSQSFPWYIWLLVPLIVLWTNSHGGFLAGICVLLAWLGITSVKAVVASGFSASKKLVIQSVAIGVAVVLAPIVNPYGLELPHWLWRSLGDARPEISEWASVPEIPVYWYAWALVVGIAVLSWSLSQSKRNITHLVIFALVALMSFKHLRHIPFMGLLMGFWIPPHLESAIARFRKIGNTSSSNSAKEELSIRWMFGVVALAAVGILIYQISQFGVKRSEYPVSAVKFMAKHNLNGRLVVTFDWAQFAIAALPESTVGFDGRFRTCYSQEVVDMHFDFITGSATNHRNRDEEASGPFDPTKVLRFKEPHLVLFDRFGDPSCTKLMPEMPEWTLLYRDSVAEVWGLANRYDDPGSDHYLPEAKRSITDDRQTGVAAWPALPTGADDQPINPVFASR